jgi:hypothetical protein
MTILCSCAFIACGGGDCPVQRFFLQAQEQHGPLDPHAPADERLLKRLFYQHTGDGQSRCQSCWASVLAELQAIHATGTCVLPAAAPVAAPPQPEATHV